MTSERFSLPRRITDTPPLPPEVVNFALSMKQPERLGSLPDPEDHSDFSLETGQIIKSRTIGNQAVRITIASFIESTENSSITYVGDMLSDDQTEFFHTALQSDAPNTELQLLTNEAVRGLVTQSKRSTRTSEDIKRMKRAYWNVRAGSFPPDAWPMPVIGNHDVVLTQAFGRNTIPDKDLAEVGVARKLYGSDEATFDYLEKHRGFDAGESNRALARVVAEDLRNPDIIRDHVLQWEVAEALRKLDPELYETYKEALHILWPQRSAYRTYEVKSDSVKVMDEIGLHNAFEFAHPDMMVRALAILNKLGVAADVLTADIPFDPNSVQRQVRSSKDWELREFLTRGHHLATGLVQFK